MGRGQLWRYWGGYNICQDGLYLRVVSGRHMRHQVFDQRFGDPGIDMVMTHVITVEGAPAEGDLAQVAGTEHQPAEAVGRVEQNARAQTCLDVLVGDILRDPVVPQCTELGIDQAADGDDRTRHPKGLGQGHCIRLRTFRRRLGRHGVTAYQPCH